MLNKRVSEYKKLLSKKKMCCVETKDDVKALRIAMRYESKKFNIKTIIFQNRIRRDERKNI